MPAVGTIFQSSGDNESQTETAAVDCKREMISQLQEENNRLKEGMQIYAIFRNLPETNRNITKTSSGSEETVSENTIPEELEEADRSVR